ncbi:hypothetical protein Tco_0957181 [Tanacetum coccineum]
MNSQSTANLLMMSTPEIESLELKNLRLSNGTITNIWNGSLFIEMTTSKLINLNIEERLALGVSLRMFTRSIVIRRRVEDLQLGIKSYQKKLNLTKPDTYKAVRNWYSNPMIQSELEGSIQGYPLDSVEVLRILKDGGEERLSRSDEMLKLKNLKKDALLKLFKLTYQERYEHVSPEVTSSQDGEVYKMMKGDYAWLKISRSS